MNTYDHHYGPVEGRDQSPHEGVALVIHWQCEGEDADGNKVRHIGTESLGVPDADPLLFKALIPEFFPELDEDDNPVLDEDGKVTYTAEVNPAAHTQRKGWMPDGFEAEREAALDAALAQAALDVEENAVTVA